MNVVCYQNSGMGMVPPLMSQTLRHICFQTSMDLRLLAVVIANAEIVIQSNKKFRKAEKLQNL